MPRLAAGLLASEKDREEHAVVVDTLRADLAPIAASLHVAETPAILPLRHVQHLVTPDHRHDARRGRAARARPAGSTRRRPSAARRATWRWR